MTEKISARHLISVSQDLTLLTNLFVLSGASCGVSLFLFTTVIGAPVGIVSASVILVFLVTKAKEKKKVNVEKLLYWSSIENIIPGVA